MQEKNLVLKWIRQCSASQCQLILDRISAQIEELSATAPGGDQADLSRLVATILFVECAQDLDLTPLELHGLLDDPRRQSMDAVAYMALDSLSRSRSQHRLAPDRFRQVDCPHVG